MVSTPYLEYIHMIIFSKVYFNLPSFLRFCHKSGFLESTVIGVNAGGLLESVLMTETCGGRRELGKQNWMQGEVACDSSCREIRSWDGHSESA